MHFYHIRKMALWYLWGRQRKTLFLSTALLSRAQVMVLTRLSESDLNQLKDRAETKLGAPIKLSTDGQRMLISKADGDGRALLNLIEQVAAWEVKSPVCPEDLLTRLARRAATYDRSGDSHHNLMSALHKSVRESDPDAALYWLVRMLEGREDPKYLTRRMLRLAIEDIGLADPQAQANCIQACEVCERLGRPEGKLALAQGVIYLALAPKSNASYVAFKASRSAAKTSGSAPPPKHIINSSTELMEKKGFGQTYEYDHDFEKGFSGQNYFPDYFNRPCFYQPVERGFERDLLKRLHYFDALRKKRNCE